MHLVLGTTTCGIPVSIGRSAEEAIQRAHKMTADPLDVCGWAVRIEVYDLRQLRGCLSGMNDIPVQLQELGLL
jgi:hypothetical protein